MYETYTNLVELLQTRLGINTIDWQEYPELEDDLINILTYVNNELSKLGSSAKMKDKLDKVFEIQEYGTKLIIEHKAQHSSTGVAIGAREAYYWIMPEGTAEPTEYKLAKFVFCWADFFGSLCTRLRITYASLYYQPQEQGCPCPCGHGEHQSDWENYTSGVWPTDENEEGDTCDVVNTQFTPSCGCAYRK